MRTALETSRHAACRRNQKRRSWTKRLTGFVWGFAGDDPPWRSRCRLPKSVAKAENLMERRHARGGLQGCGPHRGQWSPSGYDLESPLVQRSNEESGAKGDCGRLRCEVSNLHIECGCGSMVERGLPKPETRVRFPSPAPLFSSANSQFSRALSYECHTKPPGSALFSEAFPAGIETVVQGQMTPLTGWRFPGSPAGKTWCPRVLSGEGVRGGGCFPDSWVPPCLGRLFSRGISGVSWHGGQCGWMAWDKDHQANGVQDCSWGLGHVGSGPITNTITRSSQERRWRQSYPPTRPSCRQTSPPLPMGRIPAPMRDEGEQASRVP